MVYVHSRTHILWQWLLCCLLCMKKRRLKVFIMALREIWQPFQHKRLFGCSDPASSGGAGTLTTFQKLSLCRTLSCQGLLLITHASASSLNCKDGRLDAIQCIRPQQEQIPCMKGCIRILQCKLLPTSKQLLWAFQLRFRKALSLFIIKFYHLTVSPLCCHSSCLFRKTLFQLGTLKLQSMRWKVTTNPPGSFPPS